MKKRRSQDARTTIKDIADACQVSLSTVSLVMNNSPRISQATREKVLEAVKRLGYQPNTQARNLVSQSSRSISVVVPHLNHVFADVYFGEIVSGIYDVIASHGYKMVLDVANLKFIRSYEFLNILRGGRADGMLFIASNLADRYLRILEDQPYPFLLVNHYDPDSSLNYLAADYRLSGRLAADHLVQLGHQSIGMVAGWGTQTAHDLAEAFQERCRELGCPRERLPRTNGQFSEEEGYKAAQRLLNEYPQLTALMAGNDKMAIGAIQFLRDRGMQLPRDISVMGVDDIPAASLVSPGLTTIRHPLNQIGQQACERVLEMFQGERTTCRELLPVQLIVRGSTGRVPKRGR